MPEATTSIPESLLTKLYDETGTNDGACKGFYLFYVNNEGEPYMTARFDNIAVKLALTKSVETMIENDFDIDFDED